ncbi:SPOSA6832_00936 [Sporobolomyces salmonicolor]|uniref:SPOSA6832_00936-mRNA-1:cds n=1 Tax=Sporidiobolus salmonicolor TaxID=5005 RepID=A0A0D6EHC1_SPOSA|nr:SPOSA6832_00936 [Sporobolomyces salmonicolor]
MALTPRPSKRRRTDSTAASQPPSANQPRAHSVELAAPTIADAMDDAPAQLDKSEQRSKDGEDQDRTDDEMEEKWRIWDMIAEEYHDSEPPPLPLINRSRLDTIVSPPAVVSELPLEYQRTFMLMRELEDEQQGPFFQPSPLPRTANLPFRPETAHTASLKTLLEAHIHSTSNPSSAPSPAPSGSTLDAPLPPSRAAKERLATLGNAARSAIRAGEDKVGLAITLYEAVDRHIRRLDADLLKYEDSLVIGLRSGTLPSHDAPAATLKSPPGATTSRGAIALGEREAYDSVAGEDTKRSTRKKQGRSPEEVEKEREWKRRREMQKQERAEKKKEEEGMPIDPNEPTYCYCSRMIACENDDCSREWFHLECVNLERAPEGTWYCNDCIVELDIDPKTMKKRK